MHLFEAMENARQRTIAQAAALGDLLLGVVFAGCALVALVEAVCNFTTYWFWLLFVAGLAAGTFAANLIIKCLREWAPQQISKLAEDDNFADEKDLQAIYTDDFAASP